MKRVVFAGNPNVGKSAWINALSDAHFKVGNWPGVTVEKKEAIVEWEDEQYEHYISFSSQLDSKGVTNIYVPYSRHDAEGNYAEGGEAWICDDCEGERNEKVCTYADDCNFGADILREQTGGVIVGVLWNGSF